MSRILLELYSTDATENLIASLCRAYDRTVFFCGPGFLPDERTQARIISLFRGRFGSEAVFREIAGGGFGAVLDAFARETPRVPGDSYTFDLTGGSPLFIAAAGSFVSSSGRSDVSMRLSDPRTGAEVFDTGLPAPPSRTPVLFSDTVLMSGGLYLSSSFGPDELGCRETVAEVLRLWDAVREMPLDWNRFCSVPYADPPPGEPGLVRRRAAKAADGPVCERVLSVLRDRGIVESFEVGDRFCDYRLSGSAQTHELYVKGGSVLEMYTALGAACTGLFTDIRASVRLDYDGTLDGDPAETRNEIDVTMMYGHRPVFVSCKNTAVTKEYLYEIKTLAGHFGGRFAVPCVVSSVDANRAVRNRASEMGVVLVYGVSALDRARLCALLTRKFTRDFPLAAQAVPAAAPAAASQERTS